MAESQREAAAEQAAFQSEQEIQELQSQISAMQSQQVNASASGPSPAGGTDMLAQLQQLAQLKDTGALSEQEFQAAKAKLLGM